MNSIVSSSLLHFTNRFSSLKGIVSKGFRYSYCNEKFPKAVVNNVLHKDEEGFSPNNFYANDAITGDVLIPMVSFCDVPLTRAGIHASSYGKYIIGVDKLDDDDEPHEIIERYLSKLITHKIVKDESQVEKLVDYIMNDSNKIFGYSVSSDLRKRLISRINSFERLATDY